MHGNSPVSKAMPRDRASIETRPTRSIPPIRVKPVSNEVKLRGVYPELVERPFETSMGTGWVLLTNVATPILGFDNLNQQMGSR